MQNIGKRPVRELMSPVFERVGEDDPVSKVVEQLEKEEIDTIPVFDKKGKFIGDIHERNLLKLVISPSDVPPEEITGIFGKNVDMAYFATNAKDLTSRHEIVISADETVSRAAAVMLHHGINSLPVVENGKIVGILTELHILTEIFGLHRRKKGGKK